MRKAGKREGMLTTSSSLSIALMSSLLRVHALADQTDLRQQVLAGFIQGTQRVLRIRLYVIQCDGARAQQAAVGQCVEVRLTFRRISVVARGGEQRQRGLRRLDEALARRAHGGMVARADRASAAAEVQAGAAVEVGDD